MQRSLTDQLCHSAGSPRRADCAVEAWAHDVLHAATHQPCFGQLLLTCDRMRLGDAKPRAQLACVLVVCWSLALSSLKARRSCPARTRRHVPDESPPPFGNLLIRGKASQRSDYAQELQRSNFEHETPVISSLIRIAHICIFPTRPRDDRSYTSCLQYNLLCQPCQRRRLAYIDPSLSRP